MNKMASSGDAKRLASQFEHILIMEGIDFQNAHKRFD